MFLLHGPPSGCTESASTMLLHGSRCASCGSLWVPRDDTSVSTWGRTFSLALLKHRSKFKVSFSCPSHLLHTLLSVLGTSTVQLSRPCTDLSSSLPEPRVHPLCQIKLDLGSSSVSMLLPHAMFPNHTQLVWETFSSSQAMTATDLHQRQV